MSKKERKIYETSVIYRGYQTFKLCWATSYAEAARLLDVTPSYLKSYGLSYKRDRDFDFEGCYGYIDSGEIIFGEPGRPDLMRKLMPWAELTEIVDTYIKEKYE